jgi:hypothetical protein
MKKLRDFTLTDKEWNCVKRCYLKFYKEQNKCSLHCPLGFDSFHTRWEKFKMDSHLSQNDVDLLYKINKKRGHYNPSTCVCHQFEEFKDVKKGCPCDILKEKAFVQLEKFIKRECLNDL